MGELLVVVEHRETQGQTRRKHRDEANQISSRVRTKLPNMSDKTAKYRTEIQQVREAFFLFEQIV